MKLHLLLPFVIIASIAHVAGQELTPSSVREPIANSTALLLNIVPVNRVKDIESYTLHMQHLSGMVKVDFEIHLLNNSKKAISLHDEWNSYGYYNLKFEISDRNDTKYWITKKSAVWYRNFETSTELKPGEKVVIPVALTDDVWSGLQPVRDGVRPILFIRALYEQYPEMVRSKDTSLWKGSLSSLVYDVAKILPDLGLHK